VNEPPPRIVLLVEDDTNYARLVARAVADDGGIRLVHLESGEAVLAYLGREGPWGDPASSPCPDLVLLDLRLPGMDNREVLRHLREDPATRDVPVIVMTTTAEQRDDPNATADGPSGYAVKPADGRRFRRLVQQVVAHWTGRDERPA
jgi:CheY-like chemotaxis protein